ncbi:hypothetical protein [Nonomuraea zeae]|uniref:Uncharacterized protein n=1 Tax=Nonomuraea zeae TaxID=1642303 RepID=A0A5S4FZD5_9ACTN|nr:hypothetical protein [Nonomuraea zeae]TMR25942.1 hypothetical protein ETD85_44180 [Nonomuraea zeae]
MIIINATWQRVALALIFVIPAVLIAVLLIPAFLVLPFSEKVRQFVLNVLDKGLQLVQCIVPRGEQGQDENAEGLKITLPGAKSA